MLLTEIRVDITEIEYKRIEGEGYMQLNNLNIEHNTICSTLSIKPLTNLLLEYTKGTGELCSCLYIRILFYYRMVRLLTGLCVDCMMVLRLGSSCSSTRIQVR